MTAMDSCGDFQQNIAIIIDFGSGSTRAGFSGDEKPRAVVRSVVGLGKDQTECYFGNNIPSKDVILKRAITNGIITDWDSMEKLWSHLLYEELQVCPKEHGILVTDPAFSPISSREKTAELLFEEFEATAMYVSHQPVLTMYSYGLVSGLVVDSGADCTSVSPVYNSYCLPHATFHMDLAGQGVTDYLSKLLAECGHGHSTQQEFSLQEMKRQTCFISQDFEAELKVEEGGQPLDYQLPDGTSVTLGNERFHCAEILFCPSIAGVSQPGVHIMAMNSLQKCAPEWWEALMGNVVVCGGSSLFNGFSERLQMEMEKLAPRESRIRVLSAAHQEFSSWVGGSIITCLSAFQPMWVQKQEYLEEGCRVVRKKCF